VTDFADAAEVMTVMTSKVARRLRSAGITGIESSDIRQELAIAWINARDRYDPSRGVPFLLYFLKGCWLHVNRWIEEIERQRPAAIVVIGDANDPADERLGAEEAALLDARRQAAYAELSPTARTVLDLLENPHPALLAEVEAIRVRAEHGRAQGLNSWASARLTLGVISDLLGLSRRRRAQVYAELNSLAERFSKI
jgi:hypothetical protein